MKPILALTLLLLCAACGGKPAEPTASASASTRPAVAPAIIPPSEIADQAEPPSYEVAIASAAAEHNAAKEHCKTQPESVRAQCEQEANAAFGESREDLSRLRGNTP